jgi:hypothetical protein
MGCASKTGIYLRDVAWCDRDHAVNAFLSLFRIVMGYRILACEYGYTTTAFML